MTPYDYGSVMHYGATAFAINSSSPTIIPIFNSSANLGQRVSLSPIDILEVQRFYGCVPTPTSTSTARPTTTTVINSNTTTAMPTTTMVINSTTTAVTTRTVVTQASASDVFPFYRASFIPIVMAFFLQFLTI